jgi:hypothetical protein
MLKGVAWFVDSVYDGGVALKSLLRGCDFSMMRNEEEERIRWCTGEEVAMARMSSIQPEDMLGWKEPP